MECNHAMVPLVSCECRPFVSCIRCWARDQQSIFTDAQCSKGHATTRGLLFDPMFWVRVIRDVPGQDKLSNMSFLNWSIGIAAYYFAGFWLMLFSLYEAQEAVTMTCVTLWIVMLTFYPAIFWTRTTPWVWIHFHMFLFMAVIQNVFAEVPVRLEIIRAGFFVIGICGFLICLMVRMKYDREEFYNYLNGSQPHVIEETEMSVSRCSESVCIGDSL